MFFLKPQVHTIYYYLQKINANMENVYFYKSNALLQTANNTLIRIPK